MKKLTMGLIVLSLFLLAVGYYLSGQTSGESLHLTDTLLLKLQLVSFEEYQADSTRYKLYSSTFREVGHFVMYAFGATVLFMTVYSHTENVIISVFLACIMAGSYAIFDEYHQMSVPGRDIEKFDLLMDAAGSISGISISAVAVLLEKLIIRSRGNNKKVMR